MKIYSLQIIIFFLFLSIVPKTQAQFGLSKDEIADKLGWNFETDSLNDGTECILYNDYLKNSKGKEFLSQTAYYFDENGKCYLKMILEPESELKAWVKTFNEDYLYLKNMKWVDLPAGVEYYISHKSERKDLEENIIGILSYRYED